MSLTPQNDPSGSTATSQLLADLNPVQRQAVTTTDGALLVIAGAGSGKTRTLVYRVAHLVDQGVAPESILLLTFTRRASQEMLRRASTLLDERCQRVSGGTFHSFANGVLRRYAEHLGYAKGYTIIDRSDASDIIGLLRSEHGFDRGGRRFPRKDTLLDLFSKQINTQRSLEGLIDESCPQFSDDLPAIRDLQKRYASRKLELNVLDYDDLLTALRQLLVEHPKVRARLSKTYRYVMVDEFQDTNRLQAHIAALLASGHGNLMVVGDDAQSIYSFRGASFRNIVDFPQIFPDCQTLLLEQNYRSTQPILSLANAVMENASERYTKNLFTEIAGDILPRFVRVADDFAQARFVAEKILELREEGVPLAEIAVLVRAAWHSSNLELELRRRNIPFQKFGGLRFVEAAHIKDVCAFLKVAVNPLETPAWFRVLQLYDGIGGRTAQRLTQRVVEAAGDYRVLADPDESQRRYHRALRSLGEVLEILVAERHPLDLRLSAAIEHYLPLMAKKYDDASRRRGDLEALQVIASRYDTVEDFLSDLAIDPPDIARAEGATDPEDECMTISTVHSAKGLEWQCVFVLHMITGHFPSFQSLADTDAREEERRLFYVAITRAKAFLYLLKPEEVARRGGHFDLAELSTLITEVTDFDSLVDHRTYHPEAESDIAESEAGEVDDGEQLRRIQDYFSAG